MPQYASAGCAEETDESGREGSDDDLAEPRDDSQGDPPEYWER